MASRSEASYASHLLIRQLLNRTPQAARKGVLQRPAQRLSHSQSHNHKSRVHRSNSHKNNSQNSRAGRIRAHRLLVKESR